MNSATKTSKDFAKTAGKRVIKKRSEATGDLIRKKIADKITSMVKPRSKKEKDDEILWKRRKRFLFLQKRESK